MRYVGLQNYVDTANHVEFGEFLHGPNGELACFQKNEEETRRARQEIIKIAPRVFEFVGLYQKVIGEQLRYEPLQKKVSRISREDYLVGERAALKYIQLLQKGYSEKQLRDDLLEGRIIWFEREPRESHQKNRPESEKNRSVMNPKVRLFRLCDLQNFNNSK